MAEDHAPRSGAPTCIDQAVHGYERGHRLLVSSRPLDDAADQLLGSMSDLLTTRLLEQGSSYLVGYPLKSANAYVVARTWAATEMPRPGSVWTHSLILDYATLSLLEDPSRLLPVLQRPDARSIDAYSRPIAELPLAAEALCPLNALAALRAIGSLYGPQTGRITAIPATAIAADEALMIALWRQMWPALRRDTAFFGFADDAPPPIDAGCVLCFSGPETFPSLADDRGGDAVTLLIDDLPLGKQTPLRTFLARHAFDAQRPRAAVLPLVRLWQADEDGDSNAQVGALLDTLPFANAERLARSVLGQLFDQPTDGRTSNGQSSGGRSPDGSSLLALIDRFGDIAVTMPAGWAAAPTASATPTTLGLLLDRSGRSSEGTFAATIFEALAAAAPLERLADAPVADLAALRLLDFRGELLDQHVFWERHPMIWVSLVRRAAASGRLMPTVLNLVGERLTPEIVTALIDGWPEELGALITHSGTKSDRNRLVGAVLGRKPDLLQRALDCGVSLPLDLAEEAVDQVFGGGGLGFPPREPWRRLAALPAGDAQPHLLVLSFTEALGRGADGRERIAQLFVPLRARALQSRIPHDARRYLETALRATGIHRWSLSDALYEALISAFLEGEDLRPEIFNAVGGDEVEGLLEAIYFKLGLSRLTKLMRRTQRGDDRYDAAKIRKLEVFVRRREKSWFW